MVAFMVWVGIMWDGGEAIRKYLYRQSTAGGSAQKCRHETRAIKRVWPRQVHTGAITTLRYTTLQHHTATMPPKAVKPEMSAFERKRLENIAANQAMLKDLSNAAQKIIPQPAPKKPVGAPRGKRIKSEPVKRDSPRPTRTSSRLAGIEADSETHKRKAEVDAEFAAEQNKARKRRISGDLNLSDVVAEGKKWDKGSEFLSGIMRGAVPYQRTFTEDDIKETTNKGLKALREKMSGLELYDAYEPNSLLELSLCSSDDHTC